jgi:hypothetical protein
MKIRIPYPILRAWDVSEAWVNVSVYSRGRIEVRRIDFLLALGFVLCVAYYGATLGVRGALLGGASYLVIAAVCLWFI